MARTGTFGKLPKVAPDLSSTIAQMLAAYAAEVDQNMVDAWKNGGEVDGKPVTDARLLAHFKARRDELDPKSPEWQQWNNRITQYEFSIEESKMSVKWDNGQVSEAGMAAFYHKWEQKTPDNTEFDRTLRKAYGQWMKSASARSAGNAAKAKAEAHNKWAMGLYNSDVKAFHTANSWLSSMLYKWGPLADAGTGGQQPQAPTNIGGLEAGQFGDFETLVALVNNGGLTPAQKADVDAFTAGMKKIDPTFTFTTEWFNKAGGKATTALKTLESKSTTKTEANQWAAINTDGKITLNRINSAPAVMDAKAAREELETNLKNSAGNPELQKKYLENYALKIKGIISRIDKAGSFKDPNSVDNAVISGLNSDLNVVTAALNGQQITGKVEPTWLDSTSGSTAQTGQDAASWVPLLNGMNDNLTKIKNGGWAEIGTVTDQQTGETQHVIKYHDPTDLTPAGMEVVTGYQGAGAGVTVLAPAVPVEVTMVDATGFQVGAKPYQTNAQGQPVDDNGVPTTDPTKKVAASDVGFFSVTLPDPTGHDVTYYKTVLGGQSVYTLEPPLNPDAKVEEHSDGKGGMIVTVRTDDPNAAKTGFSLKDYMQWGPTTKDTPKGGTSTGGADSTRPVSPWIDSAGNVTPDQSKAVGSIAGTYLTSDGVKWAGMLNALNVNDPNYRAQRKAILDAAQASATQAANNAFRAGERGDSNLATSLGATANSAQSDFTNLMVLATAQANGDTSNLGQMKMADLLRNTKATWNGTDIVSTVAPDAVGATTTDDNMTKARKWAVDQLNMYDATWAGTSGPAANMDPKLYKDWTDTHGTGLGAIPARASDVAAGFLPGYSNLRDQIDTTKDPRQLTLPSFVTGGVTNPYLTGQSGQGVTLPTTGQTPTGVAAPGTQGAPNTTVQPPSTTPPVAPPQTTIPQPPPAPAPGGAYTGTSYMYQPPAPAPTPNPYSRGKPVPI